MYSLLDLGKTQLSCSNEILEECSGIFKNVVVPHVQTCTSSMKYCYILLFDPTLNSFLVCRKDGLQFPAWLHL